MKRKTPQEKKALSYKKDRRNAYGENDKSSRKNIPLIKARQNRAYRKKTNQVLREVRSEIDIQEVELIESEAKGIRKGNWKKSPDAPLGEFVERRLESREAHAGKGKTARKKVREILKTLKVKIVQTEKGKWFASCVELKEIEGNGATKVEAIENLKYIAEAAIGNEKGLDISVLIDGKVIRPKLS